MKLKVTSKYEVTINNEVIIVNNLQEAEKKIRSITSNDFEFNYIVRKDYDNQGKLLETWLIG